MIELVGKKGCDCLGNAGGLCGRCFVILRRLRWIGIETKKKSGGKTAGVTKTGRASPGCAD